jgi:hypothetical protein
LAVKKTLHKFQNCTFHSGKHFEPSKKYYDLSNKLQEQTAQFPCELLHYVWPPPERESMPKVYMLGGMGARVQGCVFSLPNTFYVMFLYPLVFTSRIFLYFYTPTIKYDLNFDINEFYLEFYYPFLRPFHITRWRRCAGAANFPFGSH